MAIEIIKVTERGDRIRVPLTGSNGIPGNVKLSKFASGSLVGGIADSYEDLWENPESVPILVFRVVINETVGAGVGGGEYVILGTDADGTGMTGTTFMNGFDANAVAWYDNAYGPVALGATTKSAVFVLDENGGTISHITAQYKAQDCSAFAAMVYIFYSPIM